MSLFFPHFEAIQDVKGQVRWHTRVSGTVSDIAETFYALQVRK